MAIRRKALWASPILVLTMLIAPATASSLTLKDQGKEVADKSFEISGEIGFSTLGWGFDCPAAASITVNGATITVASFKVPAESCKGTGQFSGCKTTEANATGLPWTIDVDSTKLTITEFAMDYTLSAFTGKNCNLKHLGFSFEVLRLTPDSTQAIHQYSLFGEEGTVFFEGLGFEVETFGFFSVLGADSGTYGIG